MLLTVAHRVGSEKLVLRVADVSADSGRDGADKHEAIVWVGIFRHEANLASDETTCAETGLKQHLQSWKANRPIYLRKADHKSTHQNAGFKTEHCCAAPDDNSYHS